jgi:hypothetical protein
MEVLHELREMAAAIITVIAADPLKVGGFLTILSFVSSGVVALLNRHEKDP